MKAILRTEQELGERRGEWSKYNENLRRFDKSDAHIVVTLDGSGEVSKVEASGHVKLTEKERKPYNPDGWCDVCREKSATYELPVMGGTWYYCDDCAVDKRSPRGEKPIPRVKVNKFAPPDWLDLLEPSLTCGRSQNEPISCGGGSSRARCAAGPYPCVGECRIGYKTYGACGVPCLKTGGKG